MIISPTVQRGDDHAVTTTDATDFGVWTHHRAAVARAVKAGNHEAADEARRALKTCKLAEQIRAAVDAAPPITDEQRDRLATLLAPMRAAIRNVKRAEATR